MKKGINVERKEIVEWLTNETNWIQGKKIRNFVEKIKCL